MKKYTFDNFLVGKTNKKAVKAVKKFIARSFGYRAVFIHGCPLCGKTHLAKAVWQCLLEQEKEVLLRTPEQFTRELQGWFYAGGDWEIFCRSYEKKDFLIIDDMQEFRSFGAAETHCEEIILRFLKAGKSVLVFSTQDDLKSKRLRGKFFYKIEVQEPDVPIRKYMIDRYAEEKQLRFDEDARILLAELEGSIRRMMNILINVMRHRLLYDSEITCELIWKLYDNERARKYVLTRRRRYGRKRKLF